MKLKKFTEITGKIILKSGLHIGAGDTEMHIGGTDNPVIKHAHTQEPYIPGSSFKGKVRSLLEISSGFMGITDGKPLSFRDLRSLNDEQKQLGENIVKLFGTSGSGEEEAAKLGPTRVSFADCPLNNEWKNEANERGLPYTEVKSENSINRIKGTAENPRFTERVIADAQFNFSITLKQFDIDEENSLLDLLLSGMWLLKLDALGGNGSRGYGRIDLIFDDGGIQKRFENANSLFS